ncbi:ShlB/FhaC/HecB family hemolysin secretion/activation protein [Basilea psittacipulmonis]|uniref:POTRA domain-containing protein n=1 Tax=Basilea psittacipulmonis DSM 24701 TaxID=1072685 RepID=A0A077DG26_9BURK|nr:ShlB/FhaC/HecB family hemolysin secretion/activation protein [Basilea psittacipulmonis]AIL32402.1 hypothetical protein IX83_02910 [Basilea psittacipulmonis DSM 24701]
MATSSQHMILGAILAIYSGYAVAANPPEPPPIPAAADLDRQAAEHEKQAMQTQEAIRQQLIKDPKVTVEVEQPKSSPLVLNESPCFPIDEVLLVGQDSAHFQFALKKALKELNFQPGVCLGIKGLTILGAAIQNQAIAKGFLVARVNLIPQNLKSRRVSYEIVPGKIHEIIYRTTNWNGRQSEKRLDSLSALPSQSGDFLNIRDIEQSLENIKRLSNQDVDIQILPSVLPGMSDILYERKTKFPVMGVLTASNAGSKGTGLYQGSASLLFQNTLGLNDLLYLSYVSDLGGKELDIPPTGTKSYAFSFSMPYRNWLFSLNAYRSEFHQVFKGLNDYYDYHGWSNVKDLSASYMIYRDAVRKLNVSGKIWQRSSSSYINDAELTVQRRRTSGFTLSLEDREYWGESIFSGKVSYKQGMRWFGAEPVSDEISNSGTGRMRQILLTLNWLQPFVVAKQRFYFDTHLEGQYSFTRVFAQDKFSMGDRLTVRGFSNEMTLSAEHALLSKNTIYYQYYGNHQLYLGLDYGKLWGPSTKEILGDELMGAAVGLKGAVNIWHTQWQYDAFVGKSLKQPQYYPRNNYVIFFSTSLIF